MRMRRLETNLNFCRSGCFLNKSPIHFLIYLKKLIAKRKCDLTATSFVLMKRFTVKIIVEKFSLVCCKVTTPRKNKRLNFVGNDFSEPHIMEFELYCLDKAVEGNVDGKNYNLRESN